MHLCTQKYDKFKEMVFAIKTTMHIPLDILSNRQTRKDYAKYNCSCNEENLQSTVFCSEPYVHKYAHYGGCDVN